MSTRLRNCRRGAAERHVGGRQNVETLQVRWVVRRVPVYNIILFSFFTHILYDY